MDNLPTAFKNPEHLFGEGNVGAQVFPRARRFGANGGVLCGEGKPTFL